MKTLALASVTVLGLLLLQLGGVSASASPRSIAKPKPARARSFKWALKKPRHRTLRPRDNEQLPLTSPQTFVMASIINVQPRDIFANTSAGVWANVNLLPENAGQQQFMWDPSTDAVTTWYNNGTGVQDQVYVDSTGRWQLGDNSTAQSEGNLSSQFKVQSFASGFGHDGDLELAAYDGNGNELSNLYTCRDSTTDGSAIYSTDQMPDGCAGGVMGLMVTQIQLVDGPGSA